MVQRIQRSLLKHRRFESYSIKTASMVNLRQKIPRFRQPSSSPAKEPQPAEPSAEPARRPANDHTKRKMMRHSNISARPLAEERAQRSVKTQMDPYPPPRGRQHLDHAAVLLSCRKRPKAQQERSENAGEGERPAARIDTRFRKLQSGWKSEQSTEEERRTTTTTIT